MQSLMRKNPSSSFSPGPWGGAGVNIQRASVIRDENKIQSRNYGNNSTGIVAPREAIRWELQDARIQIKDQDVTVQENKN